MNRTISLVCDADENALAQRRYGRSIRDCVTLELAKRLHEKDQKRKEEKDEGQLQA